MSGSVTDVRAHKWLQEIADNAYVSLHFDTPALGGVGGNEIFGGGYRRFKANMSNPANRSIWSLQDVVFTGLTQTIITHFGIWNAQNLGELMIYGDLPSKVSILNGFGYSLHEGQLSVSIG